MGFITRNKKNAKKYNPLYTHFQYSDKSIEYIINRKSAIEWVMERYAVTTHKESGIMNDPNDWARKHENP